jgi:acyl-CoA synthetase (AMP-forming)/AMP-acid ligase II
MISTLTDRWSRSPGGIPFTFLQPGDRPPFDLTFRDLDSGARRLAACLQVRVSPGSRVLLMLPHRPEFIVAFLACLQAGAVAVPVVLPRNARSLPRLAGIAAAVDAALLLTDAETLQRLLGLCAEAGAPLPAPPFSLEDARESPTTARIAARAGEDTVAFLQFTSGSTGSPKGVTLTYGNLLHNLRLLEAAVKLQPGARMVSWLPFFHDWGLIGCVLFPLYAGLQCVVLDPMAFLYRPSLWLQAIHRHRASLTGAPNFAYELCLTGVTESEREQLDLSTLQVAMVGAEPVRADTLRRFCDRFGPSGFRETAFYPTYGLAESTLIVSGGETGSPPTCLALDREAFGLGRIVPVEGGRDDRSRTLVGCGPPRPGHEILIVDPGTGARLGPEEIGEVWVRGPSVARGYWGQPEETERTFGARVQGDGGARYLRTGDLGFTWRGELFVCGRLKDLIIKAGHKYHPQDIEASAAQGHPALRPGCGAAFAVDVDGSEKLVIVHEVQYGPRPDIAQVIGAIQKAVARDHNVFADAVVLIRPGSLPKTTSGKIRRQSCGTLFQSGGLEAIGSWRAWT